MIGCGILFIIRYHELRISINKLFLTIIFVCLLSPLILSPVNKAANEINKLFYQKDLSGMTRITNSMTGINMFREHMLLGVGIGNYGFYYTQYIYKGIAFTNEITSLLKPDNMGWPTSNNFVVRVLSELGIVGSCIFVFFLLRTFHVIKKILRNPVWHTYGTYYVVINLLIVLYYFTNESFQFFVYWFFPALAIVTYNVMKKESAISNENPDAESMRRARY